MWTVLIFLLFGSYQYIRAQYVTVNITGLGSIKGLQRTSANVFYGVPFAKPPTGSNR